jgi:hypothetical protein
VREWERGRIRSRDGRIRGDLEPTIISRQKPAKDEVEAQVLAQSQPREWSFALAGRMEFVCE